MRSSKPQKFSYVDRRRRKKKRFRETTTGTAHHVRIIVKDRKEAGQIAETMKEVSGLDYAVCEQFRIHGSESQWAMVLGTEELRSRVGEDDKSFQARSEDSEAAKEKFFQWLKEEGQNEQSWVAKTKARPYLPPADLWCVVVEDWTRKQPTKPRK